MAVHIQLRRGSAAEWTAANPVLALGEPGVETDTSKMKVGDGVQAWNDLDYGVGATGPAGPTGDAGPTGPTGADGSGIVFGTTPPADTSMMWADTSTDGTGHADMHAAGGADELTLTADQISGLLGALHLSATSVDTIPRWSASTSTGPLSGSVYFMEFSALFPIEVSQISMATGTTAAAGLTLARLGLFSVEGNDYTLVARTAIDTTLFTASNTLYTRSLDSGGGYPLTYSLETGSRYAIGLILVGTTMPTLLATNVNSTGAMYALTPRVNNTKSGESDLSSLTGVSTAINRNFWARLA